MLRKLRVVSGKGSLRRLAAARILASMSEAHATAVLSDLLELAAKHDDDARVVLPAVLQALKRDKNLIPHFKQIAAMGEYPKVQLLFSQEGAVQEYDLDAAMRADARLFSQSLGFLKTQARLTRNLEALSRLSIVSHPAVIREVLHNHRMTEAQVVRIAARRPARPEPLIEIWKSPRWSIRLAVRRALAFNPYLPPEIGVKIVPLLSRSDLKVLCKHTGLHTSVRMLAHRLLTTKL